MSSLRELEGLGDLAIYLPWLVFVQIGTCIGVDACYCLGGCEVLDDAAAVVYYRLDYPARLGSVYPLN